MPIIKISSHVNYEITNDTATYTKWLLVLITLITECTDFEPCQLAFDETELRHYYDQACSPSKVYTHIWKEDAGNFLNLF